MRRYCSKPRPPLIHVLLGSFHTHQYQSRTVSPPHCSMQLQKTSALWLANQRTALGSCTSRGSGNLAEVITGMPPTLSTAGIQVANRCQFVTGLVSFVSMVKV